MTVLALSYLTNQYGPPSTITTVSCKDRQLTDTEDLTACQQLTRLDLSHNALSSLLRLSSAASLTHLTLSNNRLTSLKHVQHLRQLQLLNVAHNNIESLDPLSPLTQLVALIANNNAIQSLPVPPTATATSPRLPPHLHTLVLSHNQLATIPHAALAHLSQLTKLSLSHNQLTGLPGTAVAQLAALVELRLNNNQLTTLPTQLASCQRLKLIDAGSNAIDEWSGVECVERLPYLRNLQLKGNGVERAMGTLYRTEVMKRLPLLAVLDSHKVKGDKAAKDGQRVNEEEAESEERKEGDGEQHVKVGGGRKVQSVSEMKEGSENKPAAVVKSKGGKADSKPATDSTGMRMDSGRKRRMEETAATTKSPKAAKHSRADNSTKAAKANKATAATAASSSASASASAPASTPTVTSTSTVTPQPSNTAADEAEDEAVEFDALSAEAKKRQREREKQHKAEERLIRERGKAAGVLDVKVHRQDGQGSEFSVEQLTRGDEERDVVGAGAGWE